jgi:putative membrane protein
MKILINIILTGIAVAAADYLIPGVVLSNFWTAIVVGLVMGLINALVRPVVLLLTLPLNFLTLGLFTFVINALMILLAAAIVPGFAVNGFWAALLFSVVVALLKMLFSAFESKEPAI